MRRTLIRLSFGSWRRGSSQLLLVAAVALGAEAARAQACHGPLRTSEPANERGLSVGLNLAGTGFETLRYSGSYERLSVDASWVSQPLHLEVAWEGYRIVKNGAHTAGVGDLHLGARWRMLVAERERAGLGASVTAPLGARERELGMGHAMLGPNLWFEMTRAPLRIAGSLAYSRALGAGTSHAHGGPIVQPMTGSELAVELRAGLPLTPNLGLEARTLLELPTSSQPSRALVGLGIQLPFDGGSSVVEGALPILGDALDWRLTSGLRFEL